MNTLFSPRGPTSMVTRFESYVPSRFGSRLGVADTAPAPGSADHDAQPPKVAVIRSLRRGGLVAVVWPRVSSAPRKTIG